ncbi:MAG: hypothetical protein ABIG46_07800 [Candidatus Omnitrophota bacterium]|nr:hypothetical protein [Candidatus Omnitrophota bacterium]
MKMTFIISLLFISCLQNLGSQASGIELKKNIKISPYQAVSRQEKYAACRRTIARKIRMKDSMVNFLTCIYFPLYSVYHIDPFYKSDVYFPVIITFFGLLVGIYSSFLFKPYVKIPILIFTGYLLAGYILLF